MKDKEEIIKEQYKKLIQERTSDDQYVESEIESALEQVKAHSELLKEVVYYLTTMEDESELAKKLVSAHGEYANTLKEIMNKI